MVDEVGAFTRLRAGVCTGPFDRFERIENGLGAGMPDSNYCFQGSEGWIEVKAPAVPSREASRVIGASHPISLDQANWFLAQRNARGRGFLYVATDAVLVLIDGGLVATDYEYVNSLSVAGLIDDSVWFAFTRQCGKKEWKALREVLRA